MNIYEHCPILEQERFRLRLFQSSDAADLLRIYSDRNALPFFNSDNCDGDNFYYTTPERMEEVLAFWQMSYEQRWFARMSIEDKAASCVIGTVELCLRVSDDSFNGMGILRVDVRSDYEEAETLSSIFSLITPAMDDLLGSKGVITKAPIYAVERITALQQNGFKPSPHFLIGKTGYAYNDYWTKI